MLTDSSRVIGVTEAAQMLGVDRATVTRWARSGKLPPKAKLPGTNGPYLFAHVAVAHLAAQRKGN